MTHGQITVKMGLIQEELKQQGLGGADEVALGWQDMCECVRKGWGDQEQ